jgi:hypothetical protein
LSAARQRFAQEAIEAVEARKKFHTPTFKDPQFDAFQDGYIQGVAAAVSAIRNKT